MAENQLRHQRIDTFLQQRIDSMSASAESLRDAMRYALLLGGKRVRPLLVYLSGESLGLSESQLDPIAAALECIHAYSLIHDDLPAMDDDALRRGHPTVHIQFDEATAILAGDALQTLAFELISQPIADIAPAHQLRMVQALAQASGMQGMCGGQALDLAATGIQQSEIELATMHSLKTGALIQAAVLLPVYARGEVPSISLNAYQAFAEALGLAFQVRDDILDVTASTETLGKPQGSDEAQGKSTYVQLLGLNGAQQRMQHLHDKALQALARIPYNTDSLAQFAQQLLNRDH